jgi:diguanylate cyclase (GGDEF)-like protein
MMAFRKKQGLSARNPQRDFGKLIAEELKNRPLTVVLLEVDDLHHFNQAYGCQRGEKVIEGVTGILDRNVRKGDEVSRLEAGSFALVLKDTGFSEASSVCERMRASVEEAFFAPQQGQVLRTTLSAGYATSTVEVPFKQAEEFVQAARECLDQAKQSGRNRVIGYQPENKGIGPSNADRKDPSE